MKLTQLPNDHLNEFENATYDMIKNIEFRNVRSVFQFKLKEDLKKVYSLGKIMVFASKTTNVYEISKEECTKLTNINNICFLVLPKHTKRKIDKETKHFAKQKKKKKKKARK